MALLFKAWNVSRCTKTALLIQGDSENLLQIFLQKANQKLGIQATKVVLEQCGTEIDDDEVLKHVSQQVLMLLQEGEEWSGVQQNTNTTLEQQNGNQNLNSERTPMENAPNLGL